MTAQDAVRKFKSAPYSHLIIVYASTLSAVFAGNDVKVGYSDSQTAALGTWLVVDGKKLVIYGNVVFIIIKK